MDSNTGKVLFASYEDADKVAKAMRVRHNKPLQPVKVEGGWAIGGRHLKNNATFKRVKSLENIRVLFDDLTEAISEDDVVEYANQIIAEPISSEVNGEGEGWRLESAKCLTGRELGMVNDKTYLALTLIRDGQTLQIQMGGAFARHIPLVLLQANSLHGRNIIWHTWNSTSDPTKWKESKWFYMIEPTDARPIAQVNLD